MAIHRITPGDILAVRGTAWMSKKILQATGGPCSHVGLFISAGEEPIIIEALGRVITRYLRDALYDVEKAWVLHPLNLGQSQRIGIVRNALEFSGRSYGWWNLLPQLADCLLKTNFFSAHFTLSQYPICSAVTGWAYSREGLYFGQAPQCLSPAEIFTYAQDNLDKYKIWEIK